MDTKIRCSTLYIATDMHHDENYTSANDKNIPQNTKKINHFYALSWHHGIKDDNITEGELGTPHRLGGQA